MIFRQITHDDLGCASYLIGDEKAGVAAVVDPRFEVDEYLELARYMGVSIEHVFETHNHADHVSGHGRLAAATGATIHIHREAQPSYDHEPFDDGWELELGALSVRALHTPGHRPEHTAFALIDTNRSEEPWAVLSGDTLFVNDVARPDLAIEKTEGARGIFRSLHSKMLNLPADCESVAGPPRRLDVRWPRHGHEDLLDGRLRERRNNPTLAITDEDQFVEEALAKLGPQPPNFNAIVELNKGPLLTDGVEVLPLAPRQVEQKRSQGALLVDVRTDLQFDEAHIPGADLEPDAARRIRLQARLGRRPRAGDRVRRPRRRGRPPRRGALRGRRVRKLGGFLHGGMTSWRQETLADRVDRPAPAGRAARARGRAPRQSSTYASRGEWNAGHIPGSTFKPWHDIDALPDGIDASKPMAVICGSGQRAATAASLVQRCGAEDVIHVVDGGVPKWGRLGNPLEKAGETAGAAA